MICCPFILLLAVQLCCSRKNHAALLLILIPEKGNGSYFLDLDSNYFGISSVSGLKR